METYYSPPIEPGTRVRFTINALGAVEPTNPRWFVEETFNAGDTGIVSHGDSLTEGWFYVIPDGFPDLRVPVDLSCIERIR